MSGQSRLGELGKGGNDFLRGFTEHGAHAFTD